MENMNVVLEEISFVEKGFARYNLNYFFDSGVEYNDNGVPIYYNITELLDNVKRLKEMLQNDSINAIKDNKYYNAKCIINVLERLNDLLIELEK